LQFKTALRQPGHWACDLEDRLPGQKQAVRARAIVNATGPWSKFLPHSQVKLRLTKGIHLVFESRRLPVPEAVAITQGKRLLFVIPWGERVIVGTTDTDYGGPLDDVRAMPEDVEYILRAVNELFPSLGIVDADIISTWAGLRPLIAEPGRETGSSEEAPSEVARSHQIRNPEPGWWDLAGGKLTTYRLMAEQAVNEVVKWLRKSNQLDGRSRLCRTAEELLLPASETKGLSGILPPDIEHETVEHFCSNEWALHLDDLMLRRTGWHYYFRDARTKAERVADWMSVVLGWTPERRIAELARYEGAVKRADSPADKLE